MSFAGYYTNFIRVGGWLAILVGDAQIDGRP